MQHFFTFVFIGYCISLLYLTILWYWPNITFFPEWYFLNLRPFAWLAQTYDMGAARMAEQLLLNIGMFIPLGLLLPVNFRNMRRLWKTAVVSLAVTMAVLYSFRKKLQGNQ